MRGGRLNYSSSTHVWLRKNKKVESHRPSREKKMSSLLYANDTRDASQVYRQTTWVENDRTALEKPSQIEMMRKQMRYFFA